MNFRWKRPALVLMAVSLCFHSFAWGNSQIFESFFQQRETVALISFDRGSSKLNDYAKKQLETALPQIKGPGCQARLIRIEGFSGKEGSDEAAFRLSMNRAYSVASFLETRGIPCLVGMNGYGNLRAGQTAGISDSRVEIASYPKMFLFDFENARYVDVEEVKFHD